MYPCVRVCVCATVYVHFTKNVTTMHVMYITVYICIYICDVRIAYSACAVDASTRSTKMQAKNLVHAEQYKADAYILLGHNLYI